MCVVGGTQHPLPCRFPPHSEPMLHSRRLCCSHHQNSCHLSLLHRSHLFLPLPLLLPSTLRLQRRGPSCPLLLPDASDSLPTSDLSCSSGDTRLQIGWSVLVRLGVLRFALVLGLALGLVELAVYRCVAGMSAHEAPFPYPCRMHRHPSALRLHCLTPTPLDHPC